MPTSEPPDPTTGTESRTATAGKISPTDETDGRGGIRTRNPTTRYGGDLALEPPGIANVGAPVTQVTAAADPTDARERA